MSVLGIVHALLLAGLSWRSACRLCAGRVERLCAAYLLTWANLVYTGLMLAAVSRLNHAGLYLLMSVSLAAGVEVWLVRRQVAAIASRSADDSGGRFDRMVRRVLWVTLGIAAGAGLVICCHYVPNNWDSCTYRFGRTFFYLAQGNLLHFAQTNDLRLLFYPLNGVLAYVFFAIYQFGAQWMYLVTAAAWVFAGLGAYAAARGLGASHTGSLVAAWLGLMSPNVLAQATATTDEVLAAAPVLIGLAFGMTWLATGRRRFVFLAAIGIGLGCGTKLHWTFYWPFVLLVGIVIAARWRLHAGISGAVIAGCVALPLAGSFALCNLISAGKIMDARLADVNLNRPFQMSVAREKIRINTAQLFLNPIPDLVPPVNRDRRRAAYASFNEFFRRCCFSDLVETVKASRSGYRFAGLVKPDGFAYQEYTVWLGFLPHLFVLAGAIGLWMRKLPAACLMGLAAFFFWHAANSMQSLYIDDAAAYYSYPAVLSVAALGPAWDAARASRRLAGRVLLAGFVCVMITHLLLGANLLVFGDLRGVAFLWSKDAPPAEAHPVSPDTISAIRFAREIYLPYTHWEVLYWNFMRYNPAARYSTGMDLRRSSREATTLLAVSKERDRDLLPARLPQGVRGLADLGWADADHIYGSNVAGQSGRAAYALVPLEWSRDTVRTSGCCLGVGTGDDVELRYRVGSAVHDWIRPGQPDRGLVFDPRTGYDIIIETRRVNRPDEVVRTVH